MPGEEECALVTVTIHAVQQLVYPSPNVSYAGKLSPEDAILLNRSTSGISRRSSQISGAASSTFPSPYVEISIGDQSASTAVRQNTHSATYEKTVTFSNASKAATSQSSTSNITRILDAILGTSEMEDASTELEEEVLLEIRVFHRAHAWSTELIGEYACTVDSIYSAPNHSVSQFRVLLSHPDQPSTPRGWLIFSATVTKQNQAPQAPLPYVKSALRDNAATAECKRIGFEVRVYWGRDILSVSNSLSAAPPPHVYVKLRHASISTNLSTIRKTRDPTWNSSVCLPATNPLSDDFVCIDLYQHGADNTHVKLASHKINARSLLKAPLEPSWVHFYYVKKKTVIDRTEAKSEIMEWMKQASRTFSHYSGDNDFSDSPMESPILHFDRGTIPTPTSLEYIGRLLIAIKMVEEQPARLESIPIPQKQIPRTDPLITSYILRCDFYSLNLKNRINQETFGPNGSVIVISMGSWYELIEAPKTETWPLTLTIRVKEQELKLPPLDMAEKLIIRVFARENLRSMLAMVIDPITLLEAPETPVWKDMYIDDNDLAIHTDAAPASSQSRASAQLLTSLSLIPASQAAKRAREPRETMAFRTVVVRCLVYQAIGLTSTRQESFCSTQVEISFEGATETTSIVYEDINPEWNQYIEFAASLPQKTSLTEELSVRIWQVDDNGIQESIVGELTIPADYLLQMKYDNPEWFLVNSPGTPLEYSGKILLGFEVVTDAKILSPRVSAITDFRPVDITVYTIGVRLLPLARFRGRFPRMTACLGRNAEDPNEWLFFKQLINRESAAHARNGKLNLHKVLNIKGFISPSPLLQTIMQFRLMQNRPDGDPISNPSEDELCGIASLSLSSLAPWHSKDDQFAMRKSFTNSLPHLKPCGFYWTSAYSGCRPGTYLPCPRRLLSQMYSKIFPERQNHQIPESGAWMDSGASLTDVPTQEAARVQELQSNVMISVPRVYIPGENSSHPNEEESIDEFSELSSKLSTQGAPPLEGFSWSTRDSISVTRNASDQSTGHFEELMTPLEAELSASRLPYVSVPIVGAGSTGLPDWYGNVKVIVAINENVDEQSTSAFAATESNVGRSVKESYQERVLRYTSSLVLKSSLILRVHILSASGLVPRHPLRFQSPSIYEPRWSVMLRVGDDSQTHEDALRAAGQISEAERASQELQASMGKFEVWDYMNPASGNNPEFYRSIELNAHFPINSILSLIIVEHSPKTSPEDERRLSVQALATEIAFYGRTFIDLEDRWHHPDWQKLRFQPPTETRDLFCIASKKVREFSGLSCGKIRIAVELLKSEEVAEHPFVSLVRPLPMEFEIRLVIWSISKIVFPDKEPRNLFVKCSMLNSEDQGQEVSLSSDVHQNSKDGNGRYNWRFIFRTAIGRQPKPQSVNLQVWHRSLLSDRELLAEKALHFTDVLHKLYVGILSGVDSDERLDSGQRSISLKPPLGQYHSAAGLVHLEWTVLSGRKANENPVGQGREEPNRDPYLEPITESRGVADMIVPGLLGGQAADSLRSYGRIIKFVVILLLMIPVLYAVNQLKMLFNL